MLVGRGKEKVVCFLLSFSLVIMVAALLGLVLMPTMADAD